MLTLSPFGLLQVLNECLTFLVLQLFHLLSSWSDHSSIDDGVVEHKHLLPDMPCWPRFVRYKHRRELVHLAAAWKLIERRGHALLDLCVGLLLFHFLLLRFILILGVIVEPLGRSEAEFRETAEVNPLQGVPQEQFSQVHQLKTCFD